MNDLVKVSTFNSTSTGILFPCEYKSSFNLSYYIVTMPLHLLEIDHLRNKEIKDSLIQETKKYITIDIVDDDNFIVEYSIVDIFIGESLLKEDDIFALLISIEKDKIHLNQKVTFKIPVSKMKIDTIGFPGVISKEIQNKLSLSGEVDAISKVASTILSYRITDDYHHYSDLKDHQILGGLSGAPVYVNNKELIGINQSIPYFENEGNPFKNVYFIHIKHVMNYLRRSGCILYEHLNDSLKIKWIKGQKEQEENLRVLVIGGSGAGKSSFIKSFALHKEDINSSGDGQTTRTEVEYQFKRFEPEPKVEILFLNRKEFCKKRMNDVWLDMISYIFTNKFSFKELDIHEDRLIYVKEITSKLLMIREENKKYNAEIENYIDDILKITLPLLSDRAEIEDQKLVEYYEDIFNTFSDPKNPIKCMKIFNDSFLDELEFELIKRNGLKGILQEKNKYSSLISEISNIIVTIEEDDTSQGIKERIKENIKSQIVKQIFQAPYNEISEKDSQHKLQKILFEKKGFFSIEEFDFLFQNEDNPHLKDFKFNNEKIKYTPLDKKYSNINSFHEIIKCIEEEIMNLSNEKKRNSLQNVEDLMKMFFSCIHHFVDKKITELNIKNFELNNLNLKERELLSKCLKTVTYSSRKDDGETDIITHSLTSIVQKVIIRDSFSNDFSIMLDDLNINAFTLIDTHGLDHIEQGVSKKRLLTEFFGNQKEQREKSIGKATKGIDAVFYLKKLDSGRPTELDYIIPLIYEVEPQVTLYCMFTGIDIFNLQNKQIKELWEKGNINAPKSIQYLFSDNFKDALSKKLRFSERKKNIIYQMLGNTVGAFCGTGDPNFREINKERVKKILTSIITNEKNSVDIVKESLIDKLEMRENPDYKIIKEEVKKIILMFFDKASVTDWQKVHYRTARSNASRTNGEKKETEDQLGYNGTYLHRWDYIFRNAYDKIFSDTRYTKSLVGVLGENPEKVESALTDLREEFLGTSEEMYSRAYEINLEKKDSFKQLLVNLYQGEEFNPTNPIKHQEFKENTQGAKHYLNNIMNFYYLIRKENRLDDFADLYISKLKEFLSEDRKASIENILKYGTGVRDGILSAYEELRRTFYDDDISKKIITLMAENIVDEVLKNR